MSSKYSQRPLDSAKKSTNDAIKTASKRAIQKTVEATGDFIGNKTADKIKVFQKSLLKNCTQKMRIKQKYQKIYIYRKKTTNYS